MKRTGSEWDLLRSKGSTAGGAAQVMGSPKGAAATSRVSIKEEPIDALSSNGASTGRKEGSSGGSSARLGSSGASSARKPTGG